MAILEDNPQVERIEADGITKAREFVFEDNENIFIPAGTRYHKIITKNKEIFFKQKVNHKSILKKLLE